MSDLHKKALLNKPLFPGSLPPRAPLDLKHGESKSKTARGKRDYSLIPWSNYFDKFEEISIENTENRFRVYVKGNEGPVFFFLHGGGFSGLSWSLLSSSLINQIKCQCYSLDIRGHGSSVTNNDEDLSIETLSNDVEMVIKTLWKDESPQIVLVGHSMGGAIAVQAASNGNIKNLAALVVIDVVEGSALEALSSMQSFLQGRPKIFNSIEQAIEYHVRSGAIRNLESARVSIIGQLRKLETNDPAQTRDDSANQNLFSNISNESHAVMQTQIDEEEEETSSDISRSKSAENKERRPDSKEEFKKPELSTGDKYEWRIDLTKTEKFWKDWFRGLSAKFLNVHVPKLLLLAGVDRLDKELMVGQMQGKFQMQILPLCGHAVHEDAPEAVSDALSSFMLRYKFTEPVEDANIKPPKLSC